MRVPPFVRELIVGGLITRISTYASNSVPLQRIDLNRLLNEWVLAIYPEAVAQAVEMQCTGSLEFNLRPEWPHSGPDEKTLYCSNHFRE